MGFGLTSSLAMMSVDGFPLVIIGLLIMGLASPNPFAIMMGDFVPGRSDGWSVQPFPPMQQSQWHLERLEWNEKFKEWLPDPLARFEMDGPEIGFKKIGEKWAVYYDGGEVDCDECQGNGVVEGEKCGECGGEETQRFDSEIEASNYMQKLLDRGEKIDAQELIFTEHPRNHRYRKLFNATPPMITARLFLHAFAVCFIMGLFLGFPSEERAGAAPIAMSLIVCGAISSIISQWYNKGVIEAWDTITSIVKYVDAGHTELVGQVRPATSFPLDLVHVDGYRDPSWTFDDLIAWSWNYRVYECHIERYYDDQAKSWKTREVCNWKFVRSDSDRRDFMLHDGTGGIIVDIESFENSDIGQVIWSRDSRPGGVGGNPLYDGRDVRKHEWSLWALRLGDPVYLMARIKSRPFDDIPKGMVAQNASRVHHTLIAVGEDAVRRRAKLRKGTEFSFLKPKTSMVSRLGAFLMLVMAGLVMVAMSG
jgi:hypothetical protein